MIHPLPVTIQVLAVEVGNVLIAQEQEKKMKRHGPKGDKVKSIKWWDDKKSEDCNFLTHPPPIGTPEFESRIRRVPIDI